MNVLHLLCTWSSKICFIVYLQYLQIVCECRGPSPAGIIHALTKCHRPPVRQGRGGPRPGAASQPPPDSSEDCGDATAGSISHREAGRGLPLSLSLSLRPTATADGLWIGFR